MFRKFLTLRLKVLRNYYNFFINLEQIFAMQNISENFLLILQLFRSYRLLKRTQFLISKGINQWRFHRVKLANPKVNTLLILNRSAKSFCYFTLMFVHHKWVDRWSTQFFNLLPRKCHDFWHMWEYQLLKMVFRSRTIEGVDECKR